MPTIFNPIDFIPDFIPVVGHLDEFIIVPLGIALVRKMIPPVVLAECRERARVVGRRGKPLSWVGGGLIIAIWALLVVSLPGSGES